MVTALINELPVFDRRDALPAILDEPDEWIGSRISRLPGVRIAVPSDGPALEWRHAAQAARLTSNAFSGQHANDNEDWPLRKLLNTERNTHCLALAERYRAVHDLSVAPVQLVGKEAENLYVMTNEGPNGTPKEVKVVKGRKATVETAATQKTAASDTVRKLAAPVPKKWHGDRMLIAAIDARQELAYLRAKLAYVPKILDAFEWAVVDNLTLAEIGSRLGAGSKGAKGEARARIFDGFEIVDRYWQHGHRAAA